MFFKYFFYRLAEHGTDRPDFVLISIIFLSIMSYNQKVYQNINKEKFKIFSIFICFVVSINHSTSYLSFFILIFNFKHTRKIFFELLFSIPFFYCLILIFLHSLPLNSGCVIFPIEKHVLRI